MSKNSSIALVVASLAVAAAVAPPAEAQSTCNSVSKVAVAIWDRWGERIKAKKCKSSEECLANKQKSEDILKEMIAFWNEQAQGSWATIGPRPLVVGGGVNDGKVILGTSRLFVTQMPVAGDSVTIKLTKQGGSGAKIAIGSFDGKTCADGNGAHFDKGDKDGTTKLLKLNGTAGRLVFVKVDADGVGAFDYKFTATEN